VKDLADRLGLGAPAYLDDGALVYACEHSALADAMRAAGVMADALIVDAPYSERTHAGHGTAVLWGGPTPPCYDGSERRNISYSAWASEDVDAFVNAWAPHVQWIVSLTDDDLSPSWRAAYRAEGLTTFATVPAVIRAMTVRLAGDGPSSWAIHCAVARTKAQLKWGTLPGAYVGNREAQEWVGGKPLWLMRALVRDYSRPGDLIVDPCCGAGTLAVACRYEGRRALLCDRDPAAIECTVKRLRGERTKPTRDDFPETDEQPGLFTRTP